MIHKNVIKHLLKIRRLKKNEHHAMLYKVHKKYGISKRTLFYVKEYDNSNITRTILKESVLILLLASVISSLGGFALANVKTAFFSIIPLIIMLPVLNDMVGDYGIIISSKFSGMLHMGRIRGNILMNEHLRKLFIQIMIIALLTASICSIIALGLSTFATTLTYDIALKVFLITIIDVIVLVSILFIVAIAAGIYFYKKKEDPNNFLIPMTTSIADFGNMLILALLVMMIL